MKSKKCKIKLEGYEIERMRSIVNAIKDLNITTSDKACIDYDTIRELDGADDFLARHFGLVQPSETDFVRNWYVDYQWDEDVEE
jgi:hypothetical protein|tara:strand:+ start:53 stop:304 length:252 start_codon:yes stop_codon:yes gene_type:complete